MDAWKRKEGRTATGEILLNVIHGAVNRQERSTEERAHLGPDQHGGTGRAAY